MIDVRLIMGILFLILTIFTLFIVFNNIISTAQARRKRLNMQLPDLEDETKSVFNIKKRNYKIVTIDENKLNIETKDHDNLVHDFMNNEKKSNENSKQSLPKLEDIDSSFENRSNFKISKL